MDVWSLFVTIMVLVPASPVNEAALAFTPYSEILAIIVRQAAGPVLNALAPMAREDPALRASAADMLTANFDGWGLTTQGPTPEADTLPPDQATPAPPGESVSAARSRAAEQTPPAPQAPHFRHRAAEATHGLVDNDSVALRRPAPQAARPEAVQQWPDPLESEAQKRLNTGPMAGPSAPKKDMQARGGPREARQHPVPPGNRKRARAPGRFPENVGS